MAANEAFDQASTRRGMQQNTDSSRSGGAGRTSLQRRVQNALRWRSWGGEADTAGIQQQQSSSSASGCSAVNTGRSVGSGVELSTLPATSSISSHEGPVHSASAGGTGAAVGIPLGSSTFGSAKSSTNSLTGVRPGSPCSSTPAGQQQQQQQGAVIAPGSAVADDTCSVATQAGSRAHSFTSLYSMLEQGEGSEAGGLTASAALAAAAGTVSPHRGSETGVDVATSVATLPLISETGYDEQQQLLEADDAGQVSGFEDPQGSEQGEFSMPADSQGLAVAIGPAGDSLNPVQLGAISSSISGRLRMSSSVGGASVSSVTSGASDTSLPAGAGSSVAGSVSSGPTGVVARLPSPAGSAGALVNSGTGGYGRSQRASGGSSSRHNAYLPQQQQQQQQLGGTSQQQDGVTLRDLPQPFGSRKRPENDETCSYATQAGSVHSVSSIMSAAFVDNSSQRSAAPGQQQQQAVLFHPLSEPDTELNACEGLAEHNEDDENDSASEIERADVASATTTAAATAGGEGYSRLGSNLGSPSSSVSEQHGMAGFRQNTNYSDLQQQRGAVGATGGPGSRPHGGSGVGGVLDRKGSLKGAFRSVIAWGSGLGQRLQRAGGSGTHHQHAGHRQQQQRQRQQHGSSISSAGWGQQLASM